LHASQGAYQTRAYNAIGSVKRLGEELEVRTVKSSENVLNEIYGTGTVSKLFKITSQQVAEKKIGSHLI